MLRGSIVSALLFLLASCAPIPTVPTPSSAQRDATSPMLRLGSAGLKKDFLLTQASTAPEQRRAKRGAEVLLVATAQDPETGIKSITLDITQSVICGGAAQNRTFSVTQTAPPNTGSLPTQLTKSFTVPALRLRCGNAASSMTVSVTASTENGVGRTTTLPTGRVSSFGPDVLRVATFNLYAPKNHTDDTYRRWGRELARNADVLMLEEVLDQRRAELVAHEGGLSHVRI